VDSRLRNGFTDERDIVGAGGRSSLSPDSRSDLAAMIGTVKRDVQQNVLNRSVELDALSVLIVNYPDKSAGVERIKIGSVAFSVLVCQSLAFSQ